MNKSFFTAVFLSGFFVCVGARSQDAPDMHSSSEEEEIIFMEEEGGNADSVVIEEGDEISIDVESAGSQEEGEFAIEIEDEGSQEESEFAIEIEDEGSQEEDEFAIEIEDEGPKAASQEAPDADTSPGEKLSIPQQQRALRISMDKVQLEFAALTKRDEPVDSSNYAHAALSALWDSGGAWELQLAGRFDGYSQNGTPSWDEATFDYGESFIRYRGESMRVTLGTQTVIWGRIDEIPPTDRMSVQDLSRLILDDLQDRRRARPMLRIETFQGNNKYDFFWLPTFRGAELPETDSIWYPIDRTRGKILGFESSAGLSAILSGAQINDDAPSKDDGFGLRFSRNASSFDFALTAQRGRQSVPYFRYNVTNNTLEAEYPRSTSLGGDLGFEAAGATWRFEVAWISDLPATRVDMAYTEVEGVNWGTGVEFHPGDGDARVNLQIVGAYLYDAPEILDRTRSRILNGMVEIPFAQQRWRARMRFFAGLDMRDIYVNPEIAFIGWEPHEFYLKLHHFSGEDGTLGGFHEDHSLVALGWRADF